jgi:hypothetical protein
MNWKTAAARRYPQYHPPSIRPDARPRSRAGQCSSTSGMPAAHSPPMPMPKIARSANSIAYEVEKPLSAAKIENQMIDSVSGSLRPYLSAIVPAMVPPRSRITSVTVPSAPASARSTVKLCWMSMMMNARMLKSNESTIHPRNTAQKARH